MDQQNFRVVKMCEYAGSKIAWQTYAVHRVYYNNDGSVHSISEEQACPVGDTVDQLVADWARYAEALSLPVLVFDWTESRVTGEEPAVGVLFA